MPEAERRGVLPLLGHARQRYQVPGVTTRPARPLQAQADQVPPVVVATATLDVVPLAGLVVVAVGLARLPGRADEATVRPPAVPVQVPALAAPDADAP